MGAINRAELWDRVCESREVLDEIAGLFLGELPPLMEKLRTSVQAQDGRELRDSAHRLKGALLNLAAPRAAEQARRLELAGHEERWSGAAGAFEALSLELDEVRTELEQFRDHRSARA